MRMPYFRDHYGGINIEGHKIALQVVPVDDEVLEVSFRVVLFYVGSTQRYGSHARGKKKKIKTCGHKIP